MEFMEAAAAADRNFFVYLATNAPHGPFHDVPEDLREHYMAKDLGSLIVGNLKEPQRKAEIDKLARIAAMITNVDQNVGRLLGKLKTLNLSDNTLVIFLVDNGPNTMRYVGDLRGMKSFVHEGGVRAPVWFHWPGRLKPGHVVSQVAAHIDLMPTIADACQAEIPPAVRTDGRSLLPLLEGCDVRWPQRQIVIQSHRGDQPMRYHHFMIRQDNWKLLHASGFGRERFEGTPQFELYDLSLDAGESNNLIAQRPDVLQRLKQQYDEWFDDVSNTRPDNYAPPRIHIGSGHEDPTVLTRQDWRGGTWAPDSIGYWEILVAQPGTYDVKLLFDAKPSAGNAHLTIGSLARSMPVDADADSCEFAAISLPTGATQLKACLSHGDVDRGVYQAEISLSARQW